MKWRRLILLTIAIFSLAALAAAEEVNLEADLSLIKPYNKMTPGMGGTWRPDFLKWKRWSLGVGMIADISNRFYYESTPALPIPDSTNGWMYVNDNHMEQDAFDFHIEARWSVANDSEDQKYRGWLTLNLGAVLNTGTILQFQTQYQETNNEIVQGPVTYEASYASPNRTDPYISPGFLVGIGNFTVGYRQWFYFDHFSIRPGETGKLWGSLRIGYRFTW